MEIFSEDGKIKETVKLKEGFMLIKSKKDETFSGFFACKIEEYEKAENSDEIEIYDISKIKNPDAHEVYEYNKNNNGPAKKTDLKGNYYNCEEGTCTFKIMKANVR